ncbi:benzoate/H(+) symporter BenE family transporter [Vibrio comitans]
MQISRQYGKKFYSFFNLSHITAGFIAVLVGYTSSAVIIFQAANAAGANAEQISSWLWALGVGMAVTTIGLSLFYKTPILTAWSTPGAALLATSLDGVSLNQAIGVFLFSSILILVCGLTGWFEKLTKHTPSSIASAMLAGVLLQFGLNVFTGIAIDPLLVGCMLVGYLILKRFVPLYTIPLVLLIGVAVSLGQGSLRLDGIALEMASPVWIAPEFSLSAVIGIGIPLFVVTMASQNVPGIAVLRANGYQTPSSPLISTTGVMGVLMAPFGGFAFNLAAITAAICMGKEAGEDPKIRYMASIWAGLFYLLTGLFAATVATLFSVFPQTLVFTIAGLALVGTIGNSLAIALNNITEREPALFTFLMTASGVSIMGIGSAFWGLLLGIAAYALSSASRR